MRNKKFKSNKPMKVVGIKIPNDPAIEKDVREAVDKALEPHLNTKPIQHDFSKHTTSRLIQLKMDLSITARNKHTKSLQEPTRETIRQIDLELSKRGLEPIVKHKN